jgi:hypothetical protein
MRAVQETATAEDGAGSRCGTGFQELTTCGHGFLNGCCLLAWFATTKPCWFLVGIAVAREIRTARLEEQRKTGRRSVARRRMFNSLMKSSGNPAPILIPVPSGLYAAGMPTLHATFANGSLTLSAVGSNGTEKAVVGWRRWR